MAQWLAQATHNRLVVGSNPTGPTFGTSFKARLILERAANGLRKKAGLNLGVTRPG